MKAVRHKESLSQSCEIRLPHQVQWTETLTANVAIRTRKCVLVLERLNLADLYY